MTRRFALFVFVEERFRRFKDIPGRNFRPLPALNDRTIRSSR